jgi:hypothetical protein
MVKGKLRRDLNLDEGYVKPVNDPNFTSFVFGFKLPVIEYIAFNIVEAPHITLASITSDIYELPSNVTTPALSTLKWEELVELNVNKLDKVLRLEK